MIAVFYQYKFIIQKYIVILDEDINKIKTFFLFEQKI